MVDWSNVSNLSDLVKANIEVLWAVTLLSLINMTVLIPIMIRDCLKLYRQWKIRHKHRCL
jgi:hypothetical protein